MRGRVLLGIGVLAILATSANAISMVGTFHDLGVGTDGDNDEVCVFCHTPHASNSNYSGVPLWNKPTTGTTFTMYGATAEGVPGQTIAGTQTDAQPTGAALACLSCHDGVSAMNSVVNAPGSGGYNINGTIIGNNRQARNMRQDISLAIGMYGDLTNDHPVSIPYIEGAASLKPKTTAITDWQGATTINDLLRNGKVQCTSCHDPHYPRWGTYLRHRNTGSELCKTCHDK